MSVVEEAVTFECEGHKVVGIISGPAPGATLGVVVVVGGPQYRVGCHRQFVLLARRLARSGIPVMRFDYRGMGDSGGREQSFHDTAPDIEAAITALQAQCPSIRHVVLWGLCDGASASLMYWQQTADSRVAGMALLNPWVSSEEKFAQAQIAKSLQRVLHRDFWVKLARGGIDVRSAARSFAAALMRAGARRRDKDKPAQTFQERMAEALENFGGPVLVVLSGRDLVSAEFLALCQSDSRWRELIARRNIEQRRLADADHTFSNATWREEVEAAIENWIERSLRGQRTGSDAAS